jgi:hypothetical protein
MDFAISDEQKMFRDTVYRFAKEEIAPLCEEADLKSEFSFEIWRKFGEMGLLGLPIPERYGGAGADFVTSCLAGEAVGYAGVDGGHGRRCGLQRLQAHQHAGGRRGDRGRTTNSDGTMWELRWKFRCSGRIVTGTASGLRSLTECRSELLAVRRRAKLEGADIVEARAYPRASAGGVPLVVGELRSGRPEVLLLGHLCHVYLPNPPDPRLHHRTSSSSKSAPMASA